MTPPKSQTLEVQPEKVPEGHGRSPFLPRLDNEKPPVRITPATGAPMASP